MATITQQQDTSSELIRAACLLTLGLLIYDSYVLAGSLRGLLFLSIMSAIFFKGLVVHPVFWAVVSAILSIKILRNWELIDNHVYLCLYWCIALALALSTKKEADKRQLILTFARILLVFVMALAVLQKFISSTYLSSAFFELTLVVDIRFHSFLKLVGVYDENIPIAAKAISNYVEYPKLVPQPEALKLHSLHTTLSRLITWWDILVQLFIAVAFALGTKRSDIAGHIAMVLFIVTTYAVAPVYLFGLLISVWGYIISTTSSKLMNNAYVGCLILICLYTLPFNKIIGYL